jgi:hypothetical protein
MINYSCFDELTPAINVPAELTMAKVKNAQLENIVGVLTITLIIGLIFYLERRNWNEKK